MAPLRWQHIVVSPQMVLERPIVVGGRTALELHGLARYLSTPERAVLELLDELPGFETFHQVDALMDGLTSLGPHRMSRLLRECRSVKVKRLFLWFAERHRKSPPMDDQYRRLESPFFRFSAIAVSVGPRRVSPSSRNCRWRIVAPRDGPAKKSS